MRYGERHAFSNKYLVVDGVESTRLVNDTNVLLDVRQDSHSTINRFKRCKSYFNKSGLLSALFPKLSVPKPDTMKSTATDYTLLMRNQQSLKGLWPSIGLIDSKSLSNAPRYFVNSCELNMIHMHKQRSI
jgi:hypothetical protein